MNISTLSVRGRLTVGFGVVCTLLLVIVVLGLYSMARMDAGMDDIVNDRIPKIDAANTILTQTDTIAIALRNMMLNPDAADRQKQIDVIGQASRVSDNNLKVLDRLMALPQGKQLLQDMKDQGAKYRA